MPNKGFSLGRGSYLPSASPNSLHCSDLMLELTFLICCLIMQCAMHGCEYPRELYNGRLRTSCCHRCRYTNGQEHNSTCVAYTSSSHRRSRSSAPSPSSSSRSSSRETVVPEVRERHRHCFVITLGLRGHFGMQLLEHNPDLRSNAIDVRSLRDPGADQRGGPWGTCIATQQRLLRHSQCEL